jgi:nucleoside-diphosphate-sugar epimerase
VSTTQEDDLIVVAGAGGFIAGALVRYLAERGFARIRAVDKKPLPEWYLVGIMFVTGKGSTS